MKLKHSKKVGGAVAFISSTAILLGAMAFIASAAIFRGFFFGDGSSEPEEEVIQEAQETVEESGAVMSGITEIDLEQSSSRSVPFGNGKGLGMVTDAVLGIYSDSGKSYAARFTSEGVSTIELVTSVQSNAASLSTLENNAIALTYGGTGLHAFFSSDGGVSWGSSENVAPKSVGATVPTSCLWEEGGTLHAMIAWVDPPEAGDGGPLYIRTWDGSSWSDTTRVGDQDLASSPTLACDESKRQMVYRAGEKSDLKVWFTTETNGTFEDPEVVFEGADPHMAVCNDVIWVGYHGVGAFLATSSDAGKTWSNEKLDGTGKFGSIACSGETIVASWGHFPSLYEANNAIGGNNQRSAYATVSFDGGASWVDWKPAGEDIKQNVSTVAAENGRVYMLWETSGAVRFASLSQSSTD